ncbi:MAG: ribulose-phosphate 3-epimerase [bacterium]|nr:ribulose-phosphate 3-epimerase [bacterium]
MESQASKQRPRQHKTLIAPSLLSANFLCLKEEIAKVEAAGADWLHLDVMDGHFVPNISYGPMIVGFVRQATDLYLDAHLMVEYPENLLDAFVRAGADNITVHAEAEGVSANTLKTIRNLGVDAGISINPETPLDALDPYWDLVDLILVMSVHPGFGGQSFIEDSLEKVNRISERIQRDKLPILIEIDGGIGIDNAARVRSAGADVLVAGSSIFRAADSSAALSEIRNAADSSLTSPKK